MVSDAGLARPVEVGDRVRRPIAGQRQHRLVDDQHRHLGVRHRRAGGVPHRHVDGGPGARFELRRARRHLHLQGAAHRRHRQVDAAGGVGGAAAGRAEQVDLHVQVGNEPLRDRHFQGVGRPVQREAFGGGQPVPAQGEHPLGREEGRLHQDARAVAGPVVVAVRDQPHLLPRHAVVGPVAAAGHPARQLGPIAPAGSVGDLGGDAVGAAARRGEGAGSERAGGRARVGRGLGVRGGGAHGAFLHLPLDLLPLAAALLPVDPRCPQGDLVSGDRGAVDVGHDRFDRQRLAPFDEVAAGAQAHVAVGRMHQQASVAAPGLEVHVGHRGGRVDADRGGRGARHEVDAQVMRAVGAGSGAQHRASQLVVPVRAAGEALPPRHPDAEGEVGPVRRRVGRAFGAHLPLHVGARQPPAGKVARRGRQHRVAAGHVQAAIRPAADGRVHLELGPAELLDLDEVKVAVVPRCEGAADRLQIDPGRSQVDPSRQVELEVKAAQTAQRRLPGGDVVARRVGDPIGDVVGRLRAEQIQVAGRIAPGAPQPALDGGGLTRTVEMAVVEHGHPRVGARLPPMPERQERRIAAGAGNEYVVLAAGTERQPRRAGGVGYGARAAAAGLHPDPAARRAVSQAGDPHQQLVGIGERGQTQAGHLHPARLGLSVLPGPVTVRRVGLQVQDQVTGGAVKGIGQVDASIGHGVLRAADADRPVQYRFAEPVRRCACAPSVPTQIVPVPLRRDANGAHPHPVDVDRPQRKDRLAGHQGRRVGARDGQVRFCRLHLEPDRHVAPEPLAERVGQPGAGGDGVGGADAGRAVDTHFVAGYRNVGVVQLGPDGDQAGIEPLVVEPIVEGQRPGRTGPAVVAPPPAVVTAELQRHQRVEAKAAPAFGGARPFGGRRSGGKGHGNRGIGRQRLDRDERQPAAGGRLVDQQPHGGVRLDLGRRRQAHRPALAPGGHAHALQHRRGVDALVEGGEQDRLLAGQTVVRMYGPHGRRRRAKGPLDRLRQDAAGRGGGSGGDPNAELGGHRQPAGGRLEQERIGPHPPPAARHRRRQRDRVVRRRRLTGTAQRHQRLVEGHAHVRRQGDVVPRIGAQHLQRGACAGRRRCRRGRRVVGRRRERQRDRLPGRGRRPTPFRQPVLDRVLASLRDRRQPGQQRAQLHVRQRRRGDGGRSRGGRRLRLAEAERRLAGTLRRLPGGAGRATERRRHADQP